MPGTRPDVTFYVHDLAGSLVNMQKANRLPMDHQTADSIEGIKAIGIIIAVIIIDRPP